MMINHRSTITAASGGILLRIICVISIAATMANASSLQEARDLEAPLPLSTEYGETEGSEFWEQNAALLRGAWEEWEASADLPHLSSSKLFDTSLRTSIDVAWKDPSKEHAVRELFEEVAPNVYRFQLFEASQIPLIRKHIDGASYDARIPTRRPNGMNRYGLILHPPNVDGAVYLSEFERFYEHLVDHYIRPLGRLFFSEYVGEDDDQNSYAFTIRYKEGEDLSLNEHADASLITLNVNLNTESDDDEYAGSTLYFVDRATAEQHNVTFEPGMAVLHLGQTRHASRALERGERTNMVIWLYGKDGYVRIAPYERHKQLSREQRWVKPSQTNNAMFDEL